MKGKVSLCVKLLTLSASFSTLVQFTYGSVVDLQNVIGRNKDPSPEPAISPKINAEPQPLGPIRATASTPPDQIPEAEGRSFAGHGQAHTELSPGQLSRGLHSGNPNSKPATPTGRLSKSPKVPKKKAPPKKTSKKKKIIMSEESSEPIAEPQISQDSVELLQNVLNKYKGRAIKPQVPPPDDEEEEEEDPAAEAEEGGEDAEEPADEDVEDGDDDMEKLQSELKKYQKRGKVAAKAKAKDLTGIKNELKQINMKLNIIIATQTQFAKILTKSLRSKSKN